MTEGAGEAGREWVGPLFEIAADEADMFARSKVAPTSQERVMAGVIASHRGRLNPISNHALQKIVGVGERAVKELVEQLVVTHRMRIGAVRVGEKTGYYVIVDAADLAAATGPYRAQVLAMWRRLRVLEEPHALRELLGQLVVEG